MNRTKQQNRALHKWCRLLADQLNHGGYTVQEVLAEAVEREWDETTVKYQLWRPIQKAMTGKTSTADPEADEYVKIYEVLNRHLGEKFGVHVRWPCEDDR